MREVEKEIDLWDMLLYMCQKWRVLIGTAILFMVLLGAFGAYKNMPSDVVEESVDTEVDFEELALVDRNRVQQYLLAEEMYQDVVKQNERDELLSLDYTNIYIASAEYIIDSNDESLVIARVLEDKLRADWGSATDINRFNECATGYDSSVSIYNGEGIKEPKAVYIAVDVYGLDQAGCQASLKAVEKVVKEAEKEIEEVFGEYEVKYLQGDCFVSTSDKVKNYINDKKNLEYTRLNNQVNISAALSETARKYVEEYKKASAEDETNTEFVEESANTEKKSLKSLINIKYLLLGLVGGGVFAAGIYCVLYILNDKIRFEDDLEHEYGLNILGKVSSKQKRTKLDQWLVDVRRRNIHDFTYQEIVEIIASEIKVKAQKTGIQKVYATGCVIGEKQQNLVKDIAKVLASANIELISGKSILYYAEALEESYEVGSVLLLEKCNESRYVEIEQEIRKAQTRGLDIVGMVLVE